MRVEALFPAEAVILTAFWILPKLSTSSIMRTSARHAVSTGRITCIRTGRPAPPRAGASPLRARAGACRRRRCTRSSAMPCSSKHLMQAKRHANACKSRCASGRSRAPSCATAEKCAGSHFGEKYAGIERAQFSHAAHTLCSVGISWHHAWIKRPSSCQRPPTTPPLSSASTSLKGKAVVDPRPIRLKERSENKRTSAFRWGSFRRLRRGVLMKFIDEKVRSASTDPVTSTRPISASLANSKTRAPTRGLPFGAMRRQNCVAEEASWQRRPRGRGGLNPKP